jgi:hypothetical protein
MSNNMVNRYKIIEEKEQKWEAKISRRTVRKGERKMVRK